MIDRITIDIDSNSKKRLMKTLWKAVNHGLKVEKIAVSPSGSGFHIYITTGRPVTTIENLIVRAILDDDPYRIRFSLKRLAFGGESDVMFRVKHGKGVEREVILPFDLNELRNKTLEEAMELAEKIDVPTRKVFLTIFEMPDDRFEELREKLEEIAQNDDTFRFKVRANLYKMGKTKNLGVVVSGDKDTAHKRGLWIIDKFGLEGYWVKEMNTKQ